MVTSLLHTFIVLIWLFNSVVYVFVFFRLFCFDYSIVILLSVQSTTRSFIIRKSSLCAGMTPSSPHPLSSCLIRYSHWHDFFVSSTMHSSNNNNQLHRSFLCPRIIAPQFSVRVGASLSWLGHLVTCSCSLSVFHYRMRNTRHALSQCLCQQAISHDNNFKCPSVLSLNIFFLFFKPIVQLVTFSLCFIF